MYEGEGRNYSKVIGYGIGQYYEKTKEELSKIIKLDFLCDRKWDQSDEEEYDGIAVIKRKDLQDLENVLLIIFAGTERNYNSIRRDLDGLNKVDFVHVDKVIGTKIFLNGKMLKDNYPDGMYEDRQNNKICFDRSLSDQLTVLFQGSDNTLHIGKNVSVGKLHIKFGNNGFCSIGDNTEITGAGFHVSNARLQIGKDCLLGAQIVLRTHDAHHIFDLETHQRINYAKDIVVGDHVWIAYHATLLGGAGIGTGSVVGAGAVTSSLFGDHVIIAGVPAKVIREKVCWSKDDTAYFNRSCLEECLWQDVTKHEK